MAVHKISKGLNVPIAGDPAQQVDGVKQVSKVAVVAADFPTMKPKMMVNVGDTVKCGQPLFEDRKKPGVLYVATAAGTVSAINRGAKRALQSVVVDIQETGDASDHVSFEAYASIKGNETPSAEQVVALLLESGMWTAFKERPYGQVPSADSRPGALFLTCTDSEPLAADMEQVLAGNEEDFALGVKILSTLSEKVFLCINPGSKAKVGASGSVKVEEFSGKHPAGLAGTHIHMLYGASRSKTVWSIHLADIIGVGHLFRTGQIFTKRIVSLAGPQVAKPRLIETRMGAFLDEVVAGELKEGENRVISGSPLSGRTSMGELHGYLGRHHRQITVLEEGREREFLGWLAPGGNKFSSIPIFLSALFGGKKFNFTTTTNGEHREMVPIGMYERVMPLDIIPTFLLRSLEINDLERAEQLGALELDEEDVALCSFVCPGKQDYSVHLRRVLNQIYKEG
jgi:Na+-transporting NADH:ubiquinone oxidoreductase subunit A